MRRLLTALLCGALLSVGAVMVPTTVAAAPVPYAMTPSNTWWTDGVVWDAVIDGDTLYLGGSFAHLVNAAGTRLPRANVAAIRLSDGAPVTGFRADTNAQVRALALSGGRLFVGGSYSAINGVSRARLAAVDKHTGAVDMGFRANATSHVYALATTSDRLYVGGAFGNLQGVARSRMGAVDLATGVLVADFAPAVNNTVLDIDTTADGNRIYAAGAFTLVNDLSRIGIVELNRTGATSPVAFANRDSAWDVDVTPDGTGVYLAIAGLRNSAASYNPTTGGERWRHRAEGDVQAVERVGANVYFGFHEGFQGDFDRRMMAADATNGALEWPYNLRFTGYWGIRAITGNDQHLVLLGDFGLQDGPPQRNVAVMPRGGEQPPPPPPPPGGAPVELVAVDAVWRHRPYNDGESAAWMQPAYNDTAWGSGRAELGYGDGDETTVLPTRQAITWFRTTFTHSGGVSALTLSLLADDGAVVWLNGFEVARDNVGSGPLSSGTRALSTRSGEDERTFRSFELPTFRLVEGTNVLAVAVYQDCSCSGDLSLAGRLTAG